MQAQSSYLTDVQLRLLKTIEKGFSIFTEREVDYHDNYFSESLTVRNQFVNPMSKYRSRALWASKQEGSTQVTVSIKRRLHEGSQHDMVQASSKESISDREPEGRIYSLKINVNDLRSDLPIVKIGFNFDHDQASYQYFVEDWSNTIQIASSIRNTLDPKTSNSIPYGARGTDMASRWAREMPSLATTKRSDVIYITDKSEHARFQLTIPSDHVAPPIRSRIKSELDALTKTLVYF